MQTKTIELFTVNELSPKAKQYAYNKWVEGNTDNFWASENLNILTKFAELFHLTVKDYCYGSGSSNDGVDWRYNNDYEDETMALHGVRLLSWLENNVLVHLRKPKFMYKGAIGANTKTRYSKCQTTMFDCPMTGYYMDMEILDPVFTFIKLPTDNVDLQELINDCMATWVKACVNDIECQNSMESFMTYCEDNECTFRENGTEEDI